MKTLLFALGLAFTLAFAAPASAETRTFDAPGELHGVRVGGPFSVDITKGDIVSVVAEGRADELDHMRVEISGGVLHISQRCYLFCFSNNRRALVRVTAPSLDTLSVAMGAEATATDIAAQRFSLSASMGGMAEVRGACDSLEVTASMGGVVTADALSCRTVAASASMGGVVNVAAKESVTANSSMGGQIDVDGEPASRQVHTSMGGGVSLN